MIRLFVFTFLFLTAVFASSAEDVLAHSDLRTASARFGNVTEGDIPSFRRDVIPLLSRIGCSGRECHGAFSGQGGFQLSLFGYNFDADHKEITDDQESGVRIDREHPENSLVLLKPTLQEPHKGKERIKKGSWEYNLLLAWIANGAKNDAKETSELDHLEVFPAEIMFKRPGDSVQLRVIAYWKNGTAEDVTELTRFRSNDDLIATISDTGRVEAKNAGDTDVVSFYDNGVLPVPVILPVTEQFGANYPPIATRTKVDELVVAKLRKLGIVPSELCTDAEFLRRVSLDLTGTLPTPQAIVRFLGNSAADKRTAKVEELLQQPAYAAWWTTKFCDLTGNTPRGLNTGVASLRNYQQAYSRQWYEWIYKRVVDNVSYDQLAEGIILATSRTKADQTYKEYALEGASYFRTNSPADFAERPTMPYFWQRRNVTSPGEKALAFAHTFLGMRIECAQCHKHPFDQWTQRDFQQFQAFFESVRVGPSPAKPDEKVTYQSTVMEIGEVAAAGQLEQTEGQKAEVQRRIDDGEIAPWQEVYVAQRPLKPQASPKPAQTSNLSGRVLTPKILGGEEVLASHYPDPRQPLMDWLRNKSNPYFARSFVNRVWANYFGRGIVEPADDMNLANPPVNRELLDYLSESFVAHGYDMKWLHREIVNSDTYQRSWKPAPGNKLDEKNFSRFVLRRLPAEVVADAITMATSGAAQLAEFASGSEGRAIGPNVEAPLKGQGTSLGTLAMFGRPARESNCDCERTSEPTLRQTIYTRNDPEIFRRLTGGPTGHPTWIDELRNAEKLAAVANKKGGIGEKTVSPALNSARLDHLIEEVFLRTVSRPPTEDEIVRGREDTASAKDPITGLRNLLWAMLNTREFMVNH